MALISLRCPNCGGDIQLDDKREFGFCMHCGHKVLLQESVKSKVEIDHSKTFENWIKLGLLAIESENYRSVEKYADKILEQDTENGMGWLFKACASIRDGEEWRLGEAWDCFERAAEGMSADEKAEHGWIFLQEVTNSTLKDFSEFTASDISEEDIDLLLDRIVKESEIVDKFFEDSSDSQMVEQLKDLFDAGKEADWNLCFEALSVIQLCISDAVILYPWTREYGELLDMFIEIDDIFNARRSELPKISLFKLPPDFYPALSDMVRGFVLENWDRVERAHESFSNIEDGDAVGERLAKAIESLGSICDDTVNAIAIASEKKIGRKSAMNHAMLGLKRIWNVCIDALNKG
ncbi:MAG: hypothetical protein LBG62_07090 [Candidatus Methanoplasma sp.]|nr:hypothetical protein [Candidatus Methanoplasma sp.]